MGVEPITPCMASRHATVSTLGAGIWRSGRDSNRRPTACKAVALPTELPDLSIQERGIRGLNPSHVIDSHACYRNTYTPKLSAVCRIASPTSTNPLLCLYRRRLLRIVARGLTGPTKVDRIAVRVSPRRLSTSKHMPE